MSFSCPKCQSTDVEILHFAKKTGGTIGAVAGAIYGAQAGSEYGVSGTISGAVIGAITGGIAGCTAGLTFGSMVDRELLNNVKCRKCKHAFSQHSPDAVPAYHPPYQFEDE